MRVNYLILTHGNSVLLERSIHRLTCESSHFYIHADLDSYDEYTHLQGKPNITLLQRNESYAVKWASFSMIEATSSLIRKALEDSKEPSYFVLISGVDYPLHRGEQIARILSKNYGRCYADYKSISQIPEHLQSLLDTYFAYEHAPGKIQNRRHLRRFYPLTHAKSFSKRNVLSLYKSMVYHSPKRVLSMMFKKRNYDVDLLPAKGSTWWALPVETLRAVVACLEEYPELINFHKDTFSPDELVINTVLCKINRQEKVRDSHIFLIRKLNNKKRRGVFTVADKEILLKARERFLFARKFDASGDSQILNLIDQYADHSVLVDS